MIAAGYNAAAANQVIARLPEFEPRPAPQQHQARRPTPTPNASDGFGKFLGAMVQSMGDTISSGIADFQADTARKHRTHEERQTYIAEYRSHEYSKRARPAMNAEALQAALTKPATKTVRSACSMRWRATAIRRCRPRPRGPGRKRPAARRPTRSASSRREQGVRRSSIGDAAAHLRLSKVRPDE
jgi:hypothetical protein